MGFRGGRNIAMKVPPQRWEATVAFYERTLGLQVRRREAASIAFEFGPNVLWIDGVEHLSQAEVWLEVVTEDVAAARTHLDTAGTVRCDGVEPLPPGLDGFWIVNPADVVHLVADSED
jgi:catechol 2,3-dioxygenase-like lactoylglutathione lyase family enzyme